MTKPTSRRLTRGPGGRAPGGGGGRRPRRRASRGAGGGAGRSFHGALLGKLRFLRSPKVLVALLALWAVYEGLLSQHSIVNLYKFRRERNELKRQLTEAMTKRDDLKRRLELLHTDSFAVEKLAREKMGLARSGEIIYRYEEPSPEGPSEAPLTPPIVDEGQDAPGQ